MYRGFGPRKSRSVSASCFRRLRWFHQGIAGPGLTTTEELAFSVTLRELAETHGQFPKSMTITKIKVSDKILPSGGFADVRTGTYKERLVAVKTMRVAKQDDLLKIRKVSVHNVFSANLDVRF